MLISRVLGEFFEYREYVSHTLCKQRLFLGLGTIQGARRRLRDAAAWPLLRDEALRMLGVAGTLFGVSSRLFEDEGAPRVRQALAAFESASDRLCAGDDTAFADVEDQASSLRDALSWLGDLLERYPPGFSESAVRGYLAGRTRPGLEAEFVSLVRERMRPAAAEVICSVDDGAAYAAFWPVCSDAYLAIRTAVVGGALEDLPVPKDAGLRQSFLDLQRLERVISAWSPMLSHAEKIASQQQVLASLGISAADGVLSLFDAIERRF